MGATITVIEQIVYQVDSESPFETTSDQGYEIRTESDDEPYSRTYKANPGGDAVVLDTGWIKEPGMVYVKNKGPSIAVLFGPAHRQEIPPNCSSRIYPTKFDLHLLIPLSPGNINEQESNQSTKVTVTIFPK